MQHLNNYELFERAVRARVCTKCYQRPSGSETESPATPRVCQDGCAIFMNLPRLIGIAKGTNESSISAYEREVQEHVCSACNVSASAGDYCAENLARTCPLSRYLADVVQAIESVDQRSRANR